MKLCICLQYYQGDRDRAMELARFIAELEQKQRTDVGFCFYGRWDADSPSVAVFLAVSAKFGRVAHYRTSQWKWTGWPAGPNGIAREVLETAPKWCMGAPAVLMLEPDCVPLSRRWLDEMIEEWETFGYGHEQQGGAWQIGAWRDSGGAGGHVNGNSLIRFDLRTVVPLQVITQYLAWDCAIAPLVQKHWYDSWLFRNDFQSTGAEAWRLTTPVRGHRPPVLVHGYKDDSAMKIARTLLL